LFDTNLAVVGNVLTAPEWRRTGASGSLVANFRVASTARRFDREKGQWVDGHSFRVRVTAWRRLAEGVASSIAVGDPVVVYGRLYSNDWQDEQGNNRMAYEMEAFSIGHDLARGRARFFRTRLAQVTSEVESAEAQAQVRGETSVPLTADEAPVLYGDGLPDQLSEEEPTFADVAPGAAPVRSPVAASQSPSQEPKQTSARKPETAPEPGPSAEPGSAPEPESASERGSVSEPQSASEPGSASERDEESPSDADDLTLEVERLVAEQKPSATGRRPRRTAKREPVAA
jgi:single-strand DNA-binding protein